MSGDNYYFIKSIIVGAPKTGKTTFFNQIVYGAEMASEINISGVGEKEFTNFMGKSKIRL